MLENTDVELKLDYISTTASSRMRSHRISKGVLTSPRGIVMVVWLLVPISDKGSCPGEKKLSHKPLVMAAIRRGPQCPMKSWRSVIERRLGCQARTGSV
ncbi:hypothetical protein AVEN_50707-1 [Araneus ventricosus]|uniref:Uncharacterized protein n=1 Tax=Araneus ventricosus TaxID=182803 RepID=A0A4Y2NYC1_ARAVE|nr:hypothetical protein AVEN_50707-1 [Araneus ventricosus]